MTTIRRSTPDDKPFIEYLLKTVDIDEPFDWDADVIMIAERDGKQMGVSVANTKIAIQPLAEHYIVLPEHQKAGFVFCHLWKGLEKELARMGFTQYVARIPDERQNMVQYALKTGMKPYAYWEKGLFYYKNIKEN